MCRFTIAVHFLGNYRHFECTWYFPSDACVILIGNNWVARRIATIIVYVNDVKQIAVCAITHPNPQIMIVLVGILVVNPQLYADGGIIETIKPVQRNAQNELVTGSWRKVDDRFLDISSGGYVASKRFDIAGSHIKDLREQHKPDICIMRIHDTCRKCCIRIH